MSRKKKVIFTRTEGVLGFKLDSRQIDISVDLLADLAKLKPGESLAVLSIEEPVRKDAAV